MKKISYILFVASVLAACSSKETAPSTEVPTSKTTVFLTNEQIATAEIALGTPTKQLIGMTVFANGKIEVPPQNKTIVSAQFGGFIKSLSVLDGMLVRKGQTLFTLEDPALIQLQQDYLEVIGNLVYLDAEVERQSTLSKQEAGSLKAFQLAKSQREMAQAKKNGLNAKLSMSGVNMQQLNKGEIQSTVSVRAPFSGVVTKLMVNVGAYADPKEHLLEIIDLKHAHAEVVVFEKELSYLKIGQHVKLNFSGTNEALAASVFLIGREIGNDRTVKVHCHLNKENSSIVPGAYFKASIFTGEKSFYCIPSEAIVEINGKNCVFFPEKKEKNGTAFIPEQVNILATENGKSAIAFKNPARHYTSSLVVKGAYDVLSAILIQEEEE